MPWLAVLLTNLLGTALARLLTGAGLAIGTYVAVRPVVMSALTLLRDHMQNVAGDILQVAMMGGYGEAATAIGSAVLTRVALEAARVFIKRAAA